VWLGRRTGVQTTLLSLELITPIGSVGKTALITRFVKPEPVPPRPTKLLAAMRQYSLTDPHLLTARYLEHSNFHLHRPGFSLRLAPLFTQRLDLQQRPSPSASEP
jgi:hypothetical protein